MKKIMVFTAVCLFMATCFASLTQAQEPEEPSMFFILEEFVAPSDLAEFWKVQTEALEIFDEHLSNMSFTTFQTDANSFYWSVPIKSFACIDQLYETMGENNKVMLEKGYDAAAKFRDLSNISSFVVSWNEELSYKPEAKTEDAKPHQFHEWIFLYLKAGHEKEAAEATKKYKEFYDSIEENYGWNTYQVVLGNHTPCWIVASSAESEVAMRQQEKDLQEKYGEDFKKLWQNFVQHIDKTETRKGWQLADWSRTAK